MAAMNAEIAQLANDIADDDLALELLAEDLANRPGKGHMPAGKVRRPNHLFAPSESQEIRVESVTNGHATKLNDFIGVLPGEFEHLAELFCPALLAAGGIRGHHFRRCKYSPRTRLYFLLEYLRVGDTLRHQESTHQWAKSSCHRDILHCAQVLRDVLRENIGPLFPDAAEQDLLLQFGPQTLRDEGVFLFVDGVNVSSLKSTNPNAFARDYNGHKGFGINAQLGCDIFGHCRFYEIGFDGRNNDSNSYHQSSAYLQLNGIVWDNNMTICTDCAYAGNSTIFPQSKRIFKPLTRAQINALPPEERPEAIRVSKCIRHSKLCAENLNEWMKRGAYAADRCKSRVSLTHHRNTHLLLVELCLLLVGIKTQLMRGQVCQSNPAVVNAEPDEVNLAQRVINYYTPGALFTAEGYERRFYGSALTGDGAVIPMPLV